MNEKDESELGRYIFLVLIVYVIVKLTLKFIAW